MKIERKIILGTLLAFTLGALATAVFWDVRVAFTPAAMITLALVFEFFMLGPMRRELDELRIDLAAISEKLCLAERWGECACSRCNNNTTTKGNDLCHQCQMAGCVVARTGEFGPRRFKPRDDVAHQARPGWRPPWGLAYLWSRDR